MSEPSALDDQLLPRVPVPRLARSAEQLLEWSAPLLTADERQVTERAVAQFVDDPGPTLQQELTAYDASGVDSWLDEFWRDRYLGRRDAIAVNANFFFRLRPDPAQGSTQATRAGELLWRSADLKMRLDHGEAPRGIDPERQSTRQLRHLFGTTRIPGIVRDSVRTPWSAEQPGPAVARHAAVLHRGRIWALDIIDPAGTPYSPGAVAGALQPILDDHTEGLDVGVLSAQPRADWARSRQRLLAASPANVAALEVLENALLCLALEADQPADEATIDRTLLGGTGRDRWFDKACSIIVLPDGTAGVNAEHCLLDGTSILHLIDDLYDERERRRAGDGAIPTVTEVEFEADDSVRADLKNARSGFADLTAQTVSRHVPLPGVSRERAKALGTSPDAFFQLALQLAHRRARGRAAATYESVATAGFRVGRTEAMRVVSPESVRFTEVMDSVDGDTHLRRAAYDAAAGAHVARARAAASGDAPEQHLWELQLIATRRPDLGIRPQQPIFASPGWQTLRDDWLSTSSVSSEHVQSWGFGATSPQCIGVAYAMLRGEAYAFLSARPGTADDLVRLEDELVRASAEMDALLEES